MLRAGTGVGGLLVGLPSLSPAAATRRTFYFICLSLWVGFLIVPALNLPFPQLAAPLAVAATLLAGHTLIARYRRRALVAHVGPSRLQRHDIWG